MRFVKYWGDADTNACKKFCDSKPPSLTLIGEQECERHM